MSLLHLLILLSAAGALAFFFAGWLAKPRADLALTDEPRLRREAQKAQAAAQTAYQTARAQVDALRTALNESEAQLTAEQQQNAAAHEVIAATQRDRDAARADVERLTSEAKSAVEQLHTAEALNQATAAREEEATAGWERQLREQRAEQLHQRDLANLELQQLRQILDEQQAEHLRQRDLTDLELQQLRQALDELKAEHLRCAERERALQESQVLTAQDLARARDDRQRCETQVKVLTESLRQAEEGQRSAVILREKDQAAWQQKYKVFATEIQARIQTAQATWTAKEAALHADVQRLTEALGSCKAECAALATQNRDLQTKHRVVHDTLSTMESGAATAHAEWHEAQVRLREMDQLRQENAILREEKGHAEAAERERATREDDVREVRVQLAAAQAKLSDLERLLEENRKLRDEVADLRLHSEAAVELERLTAEHKRLRLDAELMARRLRDLLQDQAELADLRARFADLQALGEEVAYLRRREKDLEARLYAGGSAIQADDLSSAGVQSLHTVGTDMEASLHSLVQPDGARTAVLADTQGFLIASAGEPMPQEGLAAFAAIATEMVTRTRVLLPLADVNSIRISDTNQMVLSCRLFETGGQGLGVATLGPGEPSPQDAERVVRELAGAVAGKVDDSES
jgi:chromosome segregation ATPase